MSSIADPSFRSPRAALLLVGALLVAELGAIGVIFKHAIAFECLANWPAWACSGASRTLVALYCVLGTLVLFGMLRPQPLRDLVRQAGERLWPLALNAAGVVLTLIPVAFLREGGGTAALLPSFGFWTVGMMLLLAGLLLYLAPCPSGAPSWPSPGGRSCRCWRRAHWRPRSPS